MVNPILHHRHSIRLQGYDYTQPAAYFVTIVTHHREGGLGEVVNGIVSLSRAGGIVQEAWRNIPNHYPHVELDAFVIMPNHVHGIIILKCDDYLVGAGLRPAPTDGAGIGPAAGLRRAPTTPTPTPTSPPKRHGLPEIVRAFKSFSARGINAMRNTPGLPFWQRNYYEHIVRNGDDLNRIRMYIAQNPPRWVNDRENRR